LTTLLNLTSLQAYRLDRTESKSESVFNGPSATLHKYQNSLASPDAQLGRPLALYRRFKKAERCAVSPRACRWLRFRSRVCVCALARRNGARVGQAAPPISVQTKSAADLLATEVKI
jgi:hypothetical protein